MSTQNTKEQDLSCPSLITGTGFIWQLRESIRYAVCNEGSEFFNWIVSVVLEVLL